MQILNTSHTFKLHYSKEHLDVKFTTTTTAILITSVKTCFKTLLKKYCCLKHISEIKI